MGPRIKVAPLKGAKLPLLEKLTEVWQYELSGSLISNATFQQTQKFELASKKRKISMSINKFSSLKIESINKKFCKSRSKISQGTFLSIFWIDILIFLQGPGGKGVLVLQEKGANLGKITNFTLRKQKSKQILAFLLENNH